MLKILLPLALLATGLQASLLLAQSAPAAPAAGPVCPGSPDQPW
jgi:hypothetical protein